MGMKNLLLKNMLLTFEFHNTVSGATDMEIVPVYVGLDYHSETIRVCVMDLEGETLVNRSVANDPAAVVDLVRATGGLVRAVSIEACCGAADFATALAEMTEWTVRMAHPSGVNRMKQGPDKTDHTDAWHLANLLRVGYLPHVWLADEATRQLRRLVRYRAGLVAQKKDIKLRILSLLREERIENTSGASSWAKPWMEWIKSAKLGEQSRWVLDQELRRLEQAEKDLAEVDARMDQATQGDAVVAKLKEQPGIGPVTAVTMRAVIGRFDRFRTGKQLSKYCGVSPCNASSGGRQSDAGLIESGNDILRPLLMQLAKRLPRQDPHWKELHGKLRITKGANVASAAIANRWLRRLYHEMVTKVKVRVKEELITNIKLQAS
jgi:transposase